MFGTCKYEQLDKGFCNGNEWAKILENHVKNDDYNVKVNGKELQCYNVRVSKMAFNRIWPGYQRDISQSEVAAVVQIFGDERLEFEVKPKKRFSHCLIRPLSKGIEPKNNDGTIKFTVEKNGYYVLELDNQHNCLHIFYNAIKEYPEKDKATYYFGAGFHFPGVINLKSGDSVYIDKDAYVYGSLFGDGVKNVKVYGQGVIDGSYEARIFEHAYERFTKGNVKFYNSENISIEGVVLKDSAIWSLACFACKNVNIKGVKIVGQWRYNTDGIDICNCENVTVSDCFIRSFDDVVTIKGIAGYMGNNPINIKGNKNVFISDCVMWCGWGRSCEIGYETDCDYYDNIKFSRCDLIHNSCVAIDINHGQRAHLENITFENLNVELCKEDGKEIYQFTDDQTYESEKCDHVTRLIHFSTERHKPISNVTVKNLNVFTEKDLPKPTILIDDAESVFKNIIVENININGKKAGKEDFKLIISEKDKAEIKLF